mgnify:CR=1 FL=1
MIVFGVDVPLVELMLVFIVIITLLLIEALVVIVLLMSQTNRSRKQTELLEKLSQTMLEIKKAEITELEKIRKK